MGFSSISIGQNKPTSIIKTKSSIISSSQCMVDKTRNRSIPIQTYVDKKIKDKAISDEIHMPVVIINHGYGVRNTEYSSIANYLASQGYFVISIQHDLNTDSPLSRTGNLYQRRKPLWDRGVLNLLFIEKVLATQYPFLNFTKVILVGHSNGGDISMLFAKQYPHLVQSVISLDSLRMPFPRDSKFPILSIRANDTNADPGVLPDRRDYRKLKMTIVRFNEAKHIELCDRGNKSIQNKINFVISNFLNKRRSQGFYY
ncbi:Alpha/beta hydrolase family protein [Legionella clemsonensis]|uniref:Alpha/beta hydrolase family protein n=2 Tax=Legionella clemsonensis TaxID=1867846 RepID=A0A222P243_9GAMM|nr:Alpha/beta hydrolase family protein [Legionella clemsonensis]